MKRSDRAVEASGGNRRYDVCIMTSVHPRGDSRIYCRQARTLARRYRVLLLAHDGAEGLAGTGEHSGTTALDRYGIGHMRIKTPRSRLWRIAAGWAGYFLAALQSGARICILHDPELIPAGLLLRRLGRRTVLDIHEQLGRQTLTKDWIPAALRPAAAALADALIRAAAKRFDAVLCASPAIKRELGGRGTVVRNYPLTEEYPALRPGPRRGGACYIGTISVRRGMDVMARAASTSGITLHVAGDIEDARSRELIRAGRRSGCIRYYGRLGRKDVARLLGRCTTGLCLLRPEGGYPLAIPVKLFEYLAAGLRVVASDFPYWRRLTAGLDCVDFISPEDAGRAAELLRQNASGKNAVTEPERRELLVRFCWEKESKRLMEAMEKL